MPALIITPIAGYELSVFPVPLVTNGTSGTYVVSGWEWWQLHWLAGGVDNSAGAGPATMFANVTGSNVVSGQWNGPGPVAIGDACAHFFSVGAVSQIVSSQGATVALGEVTIIGDGSIAIGFVLAAAGVRLLPTTAAIIGRRHRTNSHKE